MSTAMSLTHAQSISLAGLSIATVTAFLVAIHASSTELASLWTRQCSPHNACHSTLLASRGGMVGGGAVVGRLPSMIPRLACFAVSFFQTALGSTRGKLEEAAIVAFVAGLASITATESARTRRRRRRRATRTTRTKNLEPTPLIDQGAKQESKDTTEDSLGNSGEAENQDGCYSSIDILNNPVNAQTEGTDDLISDASAVRSSFVTAHNLTLPWLLYNLLLGALAWQALIVPAFLREEQQQQRQRRQSGQVTRGDRIQPPESVAVAVSIIAGLLLPATIMISSPQNEPAVLAFLVFPMTITFVQNLIDALLQSKPKLLQARQRESDPPPSSSNRGGAKRSWLVYTVPIMYSLAAHLLLLHNLWLAFHQGSSFPYQQQQQQQQQQQEQEKEEASDEHITTLGTRTSAAALLLLEIDHTAIFLTVLFWLCNTEAGGIFAACVMVLSSLLAGPGAGVCLAWMYREGTRVSDGRRQHTQGVNGSGTENKGSKDTNSNSNSSDTILAKNKRGTVKRRASGKATTGHWFGGPDTGA